MYQCGVEDRTLGCFYNSIQPEQIVSQEKWNKKCNTQYLNFLFQNAMQIVGFVEHESQSVFEVVAAVLKLGNIEFKPESRVNGLDESKIKDKNGKSTVRFNLLKFANALISVPVV